MCCRFYIEPVDEMERLIEENKWDPQFFRKIKMKGEIFPGDTVPVIATARNLEKRIFAMEWGFHLQDRKRIFNTRSETAQVKSLFRESILAHRCVVPASCYFEWDAEKTKYMIRSPEKRTWLAGIYRLEGATPVFSILTREPSPAMAVIHSRMPVILPTETVNMWIAPGNAPEPILEKAVMNLIPEKTEGGAHL